VVGFDDAGGVSIFWSRGEGLRAVAHSNGLASFWGIFPTVVILVRVGGCPIGGGGVVLPWETGSKGSGAGILSQKAR
jgi:hypothetical protein